MPGPRWPCPGIMVSGSRNILAGFLHCRSASRELLTLGHCGCHESLYCEVPR